MTTFIQLKPRLINILMNAIQVETDAQNTHMLLGGLMLCVQDSALFEESAEYNLDTRQTSPAPSDTNLLSSGEHFITTTWGFRLLQCINTHCQLLLIVYVQFLHVKFKAIFIHFVSHQIYLQYVRSYFH